jgi:Bifunctional DNA primase/polymerase, N-terminal
MSLPQDIPQSDENRANPSQSNNIAPSERRPRQRPRERASAGAPFSPTPASKLWWALRLAKAGFNIFPVKPNSKEPAIKGWQTEATSDHVKINAWWAENPDYNIAIHTIDRLVVDLDVKDGGPEAWRDLVETQELLGEETPETMTTRTPSGGLHHIFSLKPGTQVSNSVRKLGPGIDTRGKGGYVLGPGSSIDGRYYELISGKKKAMYAPAWLLGRMSAPRDRSKLAGVRLNEETEKTVAEADRYIKEDAPFAEEGERNITAFRVAADLGDIGVTIDTAGEKLLDWNEEKTSRALDREELETTLASAYGTGRQKPFGTRNPDIGDKVFEGVEWPSDAEVMAKAPPKAKLKALIPPDRDKWVILDFEEAAKLARLARDPLIKGVLCAGEISLLWGVRHTQNHDDDGHVLRHRRGDRLAWV